ncbi:hypothetical protein GQ457_08G010620 [Hibiscus cannabinus]
MILLFGFDSNVVGLLFFSYFEPPYDCSTAWLLGLSLQENRYIAAQLVAFLGQTPQSFTTSVAFSRKTPLVNFSGVFAPNAASFWRFCPQTPQLVNCSGVFATNAASFVGTNAVKYHILVAFFSQTPQLVNISGVLAPNAASFVARKQLKKRRRLEVYPISPFPFPPYTVAAVQLPAVAAFRRSPVARRRPPAAVRPSEPKR